MYAYIHNYRIHQDHWAYVHHPDHQDYQPVPYFFKPGQEASENVWPPGTEKWPFYNKLSI